MWDEPVPIHVASRFDDDDGFRAGRPAPHGSALEAAGASLPVMCALRARMPVG